ncbi:Retinoblastoma-binding protein 5 [Sparganum proliferum]
MNLELLEAFHQNYPEAADGHLERIKKDEPGKDSGCATFVVTLQFNRAGSLIAIGCNDGRVEIWDFITRRIAKILVAHSHPVCSLSWSRNSRQLLSASTDNSVSVWNVITGECEKTFTFPCPVMKVQFNPRKATEVLVCPLRHPPVLIETDTGTPTIIHPEDDNDFSIVAAYDRRGARIYTGNSKGKVCIYDSKTLKLVNSFRSTMTATNAAVKSIEFSRRGDFFLLNCADRIIRVYNCSDAIESSDPEPVQKLRDLVTGHHWRKCCFSGDGEFICAGSMKQHSIYIWERASGTLVKILHGQKGETLLDVVWHPLRPIVVSISNSVTKEQVSIWAQTQVQNWSAFAPDFKELDENVEYEERESEFDVEDEDKKEVEKDDGVEQDVIIEVERIEPVAAMLSSDEETEPEDVLMFLSISPDVDNPDELSGGEDSNPVGGDGMRKHTDQSPPSKRGRTAPGGASVPARSFSIDLPDAPNDEIHPLLGSKKQMGKTYAGNNGSYGGGGGGSTGPGKADASDMPGTHRKGYNRNRERNRSRK